MSEVLSQLEPISFRGSASKGVSSDRSPAPDHNRARSRHLKATPPGGAAPLPSSVVKSFNTWAFKREQPDNIELAERAAAVAIENQRPLPFVLYWGKGPRNEIAAPDQKCKYTLA